MKKYFFLTSILSIIFYFLYSKSLNTIDTYDFNSLFNFTDITEQEYYNVKEKKFFNLIKKWKAKKDNEKIIFDISLFSYYKDNVLVKSGKFKYNGIYIYFKYVDNQGIKKIVKTNAEINFSIFNGNALLIDQKLFNNF